MASQTRSEIQQAIEDSGKGFSEHPSPNTRSLPTGPLAAVANQLTTTMSKLAYGPVGPSLGLTNWIIEIVVSTAMKVAGKCPNKFRPEVGKTWS